MRLIRGPFVAGALMGAVVTLRPEGGVAWAATPPASETASAAGRTEPVVALVLPVDQAERSDLEGAGERLKELSVSVLYVSGDTRSLERTSSVARGLSNQRAALAVLWISTWRAERTLFVHDGKSGRTLARPLPRAESPEAAREELAIVVRGIVNALLEGSAPPLEEVPSSASSEADTAADPRAASGAAAAGTGASTSADEPDSDTAADRGATDADRHSTDGFGAGVRAGYGVFSPAVSGVSGFDAGPILGARLWGPFQLMFDASYGFLSETSLSLGGSNAMLHRHPIMLGAGKALVLGSSPRFWLSGELTFTADRMVRRTLHTPNDVMPTSSDGRWLTSLGARLGGAVRLARGVGIYTLFNVEATTSSFAYAAASEPDAARAETRGFVAHFDVGASFDMLGSAPSRDGATP